MEIILLAVVAVLVMRQLSGGGAGGGGDLPVGTYSRSAPGDLYDPHASRDELTGQQVVGGVVGAGGCLAAAAYLGAPQAGGALAPLCAKLGELAAPGFVKGTKAVVKGIEKVGKEAIHVAAPALHAVSSAAGAVAHSQVTAAAKDYVKAEAGRKAVELIAYANPITAPVAVVLNAKQEKKKVAAAARTVGHAAATGAKAATSAVKKLGVNLNPFSW